MVDMYKEIEKVNNHWGDRMPMMAMEEMAELIQAVSKYERLINKDYTNDSKEGLLRERIVEEMADVYISCNALCHRYEINTQDILDYINIKLSLKY